jgi:hypothetical protein
MHHQHNKGSSIQRGGSHRKIRRGPWSRESSAEYELCLEEIDELVAALFVAASRNPIAYIGSFFKSDAKQYLRKDNSVKSLTDAIRAD